MFTGLKRAILQSALVRNLNNLRYQTMYLSHHPADLTPEYYERVKHIVNLEHQIGRLQNFRDIINTIAEKKLPGDFIEFGTWRGFSLLWTAYFCERAALFDRDILGVDGFVGLPNDDGEFKAGTFVGVTRKSCEHGIKMAPELGEITRKISIYQSMFGDTATMQRILSGRKFAFIHIDCDIGSAAEELFARIRETDCLADACYILFDDYGCDSSLKEVVDRELQTLGRTVTEHSSTNLTKNFLLTK